MLMGWYGGLGFGVLWVQGRQALNGKQGWTCSEALGTGHKPDVPLRHPRRIGQLKVHLASKFSCYYVLSFYEKCKKIRSSDKPRCCCLMSL